MRLYQGPRRRKKELSYRCLTSGVVSVTFQYYYSLVLHLSSTSIVSSTVIWKLTIAWIEQRDFIYGRISSSTKLPVVHLWMSNPFSTLPLRNFTPRFPLAPGFYMTAARERPQPKTRGQRIEHRTLSLSGSLHAAPPAVAVSFLSLQIHHATAMVLSP